MIYVIGEDNSVQTLRLLQKARKLADAVDGACPVWLIRGTERMPTTDERMCADAVRVIRIDDRQRYAGDGFVDGLMELLTAHPASLLLFPAQPQYREWAAVLSAKLGCVLLPDCTDLQIEEGIFVGLCPSRDGQTFTRYRFAGRPPFLALLQAAASDPDTADGDSLSVPQPTGSVQILDPPDRGTTAMPELVELRRTDTAAIPIRDAELIFSGGRGLQCAENFSVLRRVAACYRAAVGGSRPVVDRGWAGVEEQIGQTGSFVHPKVYVAFGISGAVQHLAGIRESQCIIGVNPQPDAPIFRHCAYALHGDANAILRSMLQILQPSAAADSAPDREVPE